MQWVRPEILQSTQDLSKHMAEGTAKTVNALHRAMEYLVCTPERGFTLKADCTWDASKDFLFRISGWPDTDYAKDPETCKSVTGTRVSVNGSVTQLRSNLQHHVTLSVTEYEQAGCVTCAQDIIYQKSVLELLSLKVKLPVILECDNKGAADLANNWTAGGRNCHVDVRQNWLRELKEQGILIVTWIAGSENDADTHTKDLGGPDCKTSAQVYFVHDQYTT